MKNQRLKKDVFSPKEWTIILKKTDECLTTKAIAADLKKSPSTVDNQLKAIYRKLNINNELALSKWRYTELHQAKVIQMFPKEEINPSPVPTDNKVVSMSIEVVKLKTA